MYERGLTNPSIADRIRKPLGDDVVRCDSADPRSIVELRNSDINSTACEKGKDSLIHSIQWLQGKKIVVDRRCQNTINELSMYQWQKDKDGNSINQPVDKNNHLIDALRYSYMNEMGVTGTPGLVVI
jgi:phage terminase large subunit